MNSESIFNYMLGMRSDLQHMEDKGVVDASFIQKSKRWMQNLQEWNNTG